MNEAIRRRAGRWGWTAALATLLIWAFRGTEFDGRRLIQGIPRGWSFIREMFPPDWSLLWKSAEEGGALANLVITLQMAVIGTFIGFVLALPVSFLAARTEVVPRSVSIAVKYSLNVLRAVPSFVYAVLFVYMVGLGPFTGKAFRIGHLGDLNPAMILGCLGGIEAAMQVQGIPFGRDGVARAIACFAAG